MNETHENRNLWDELAALQAEQRKKAESAPKMLTDIQSLTTEERIDLFIAICSAGEDYDKTLRLRWHILDNLPDIALISLIGIRMPVRLISKIERRLTKIKSIKK